MTMIKSEIPEPDPSVRDLAFVLNNIYPIECPKAERSTLQKMQTMVRRWQKVMGTIPLIEITRSHLLKFRNDSLKAGLSDATVNGNIRTVICLIRIGGHHIDGMRLKLNENTQLKPTPTLEQLNRIWNATTAAQWPVTRKKNRYAVWTMIAPELWWRGVLMLAFSTGLRRGDLFSLRWSQIEKDRIPTINHKTKKHQFLPIPEPLRPWLELLRKQGTETVLSRSDRIPQIGRELTHFGQLADCPTFGLQAMRRASARAYETAHAGCGRLILNHGATVTDRFYLDPFETLQTAATKLVYPSEFLTPVPQLTGIRPDQAAPPPPSATQDERPQIIQPLTRSPESIASRPTLQPSPLDFTTAEASPWDFL